MTVKITYFVHGTTTDNEAGLTTGWLPGELSDTGQEQTRQLGEQVAHRHFDIVFCSDLQRAIDSAKLAFAGKYTIVQDSRLRECNYGEYDGQPVAHFKSRLTDFIDTPFPGGESYRDVEHRMSRFVSFLRQNYSGKHVALVAHQAPQLALDVLLASKTWSQAIAEDWRHTHAWQPGWDYIVDKNTKI